MPPAEDLTEKNSLRLYTVDAALLKVSEPFFQRSPVEAQVALGAVWDVSGVLGRLLDGGHSVVAGRLAGALHRVGRDGFADDICWSDAYHSLSFEGYSVTPELIDRLRQGGWNPHVDEQDRQNRDALAARGYWQAFQSVKKTVGAILEGAPAGALVQEQHRDWYRELFGSSVAAGILRASALAGYRGHPVYLWGSWHVPPRSETVADGMNVLFALLEREAERAVLGHWLVGYVHPYPDGNGRMARFLVNAMLASGGYPWTVVRVEDRTRYLACLETASVEMNVAPFAALLAERVKWSAEQAGRA